MDRHDPRHPRNWPIHLGFFLLRGFSVLPLSLAMGLGRALGRLGMRLAPRRVCIVDTNLRLCFPDLSARERRRLRRAHFESMGMGLADVALAWWAEDTRLAAMARIHGAGHAREAFARGKGVIFLTAHFTSMEMSGRLLDWIGPMYALYRPQRNPLVEHLVSRYRARRVQGGVIPREQVRAMLRALRRGHGVWFAPDQNYGHKGSRFSPFFGIPAATNTATSRFAALSGAPVVPFVALRRAGGKGYDLYIEPALEGFPSGDPQADADRMNALFEGWIRRAPEQYLWGHRRFKDRPGKGDPSFYACSPGARNADDADSTRRT